MLKASAIVRVPSAILPDTSILVTELSGLDKYLKNLRGWFTINSEKVFERKLSLAVFISVLTGAKTR